MWGPPSVIAVVLPHQTVLGAKTCERLLIDLSVQFNWEGSQLVELILQNCKIRTTWDRRGIVQALLRAVASSLVTTYRHSSFDTQARQLQGQALENPGGDSWRVEYLLGAPDRTLNVK